MLTRQAQRRVESALPRMGMLRPALERAVAELNERPGLQDLDALPRPIFNRILVIEARLA